LNEALRQACRAAGDRVVSVDLGEAVLHRYRGELWVVPKIAWPAEAEWRGEAYLGWGGDTLRFERVVGSGIALERLAGRPLAVRRRLGGERIQPDRRRPRRALKHLLRESGVPPWQRASMPLLWCEAELVWVPGIGTDVAWQCRPGEAGLMPVWEPGNSQSA
jgi:tRNA(Ile)-lysidine synthase